VHVPIAAPRVAFHLTFILMRDQVRATAPPRAWTGRDAGPTVLASWFSHVRQHIPIESLPKILSELRGTLSFPEIPAVKSPHQSPLSQGGGYEIPPVPPLTKGG
jgi:hypothetical protein